MSACPHDFTFISGSCEFMRVRYVSDKSPKLKGSTEGDKQTSDMLLQQVLVLLAECFSVTRSQRNVDISLESGGDTSPRLNFYQTASAAQISKLCVSLEVQLDQS